MRKNISFSVKAITEFEQGFVSCQMKPYNVEIVERSEDWITFRGRKCSLWKATRILSFLRAKGFEFYIRSEA